MAMSPSVKAQAIVHISGTGSGTGGMQVLANAFMKKHRDVTIQVQPALGSTGGIRALIAGRLELAVSNRMPTSEEMAKAPMVSVEYARTPFVIAVHNDLKLTALTSSQLAAVFAEGPATFPDGNRARPVFRPADPADTNLLRSFSPAIAAAHDKAAVRRGMLTAGNDSDTADMLETVAGAISGTTLALILSEKRPLTPLTIDGKVPTVTELNAGRYPYFKPLYMMIRRDAGTNTKHFAAFVHSEEASALLRANGHAPT